VRLAAARSKGPIAAQLREFEQRARRGKAPPAWKRRLARRVLMHRFILRVGTDVQGLSRENLIFRQYECTIALTA